MTASHPALARHRADGFTLIELVVVIVVLGILSATALPKFISLSGDAKVAKMKGFAGALASGVQLAQAKWQVSGKPAAGIDMNGQTVLFNSNGVPTAATVQYVLQPSNPDNGIYPTAGTNGIAFCDSTGGSTACGTPPNPGLPAAIYASQRSAFTYCAFIYYTPTTAGASFTLDTANLTTTYCQ